MTNNYFSKNIRYLRKKYGITQSELAKRIGKTKNAVSNWEQGIRQPIVLDVIKICNYFDIDFSDLMESDLTQQKFNDDELVIKGLSEEEKKKIIEYYKFIISQRKENTL